MPLQTIEAQPLYRQIVAQLRERNLAPTIPL